MNKKLEKIKARLFDDNEHIGYVIMKKEVNEMFDEIDGIMSEEKRKFKRLEEYLACERQVVADERKKVAELEAEIKNGQELAKTIEVVGVSPKELKIRLKSMSELEAEIKRLRGEKK